MPSGGQNEIKSEEMMQEVLYVVSTTPWGLDEICERNPHLPCARTIYRWLADDEHFDVRYSRAKERQSHVKLEHAYEILRQAEEKKIFDEKGGSRMDSAAIQSARNRVDFIKWDIARSNRKKFGDQLEDLSQKQRAPWVFEVKQKD
jgi:hypothetical protein